MKIKIVLGGVMDFEDLNWEERPYSAIAAYAQSKLANILFTKELARRIEGNVLFFQYTGRFN